MSAAVSWINAGANLLNSFKAPPAAPAVSGAPTAFRNDADFSGFTVATGSARADGATISKTSTDGGFGTPGAAAGGPSLGSIGPLLVGIAAIGGLLWSRSSS